MPNTRRSGIRLAAFLLAFIVLVSQAVAALSRPPSSRTEPSADGQHIVVFIAPIVSLEESCLSKEDYERAVKLNSIYPASGCYEVGSTTPLWTVP